MTQLGSSRSFTRRQKPPAANARRSCNCLDFPYNGRRKAKQWRAHRNPGFSLSTSLTFLPMSYLSIALTRFSEQNQLKQTDVGRISGLTRSHVSRIFAGEQKSVTDDDFLALLRVFPKQIQVELIAARCMDAKACALGIAAADLVEIKVSGAGQAEKREIEPPQVHLSQETERAFAFLRSQCPLNPDLEQHLVGYARLMGMQ